MEKTTTIRLEINGEPAKNTLDELRQRAEILSQKISAIKFPAQCGESNPLGEKVERGVSSVESGSTSNARGLTGYEVKGLESGHTSNLTEQQLRDLKRLEQEYASVTAEIERQEQALQGVARVMSSLAKEYQEKEGLGFWGNLFRWPQWYKDKHTGKGVSIGGMTNDQVMELYRVLTDIKYQLAGTSGNERLTDSESGEEFGAYGIKDGVIKIELVNGKTIEIKNARELEAVMQELLSQMNDFFQLAWDYNEANDVKGGNRPSKYRKEDEWKLGKDNENFIRMSTGEIDYRTYYIEQLRIEQDYLECTCGCCNDGKCQCCECENEHPQVATSYEEINYDEYIDNLNDWD